ncbi:MAG: hypothetical protein JST80_02515 [Bdellovibrionales bacterium]|nr:hypothetical protein [Bdellovibrionales bacterium]
MRCIKKNMNFKLSTKSGGILMFLISAVVQASNPAQASFDPVPDLKLGLNGRTYPIGAQITVSAGLGQELWKSDEKPAPGKVDWKYGYARLALNGATSAVVNRIGGEFQLYPISILGFGAGYDVGSRNFTPKSVDCSNVECNGLMTRKFLRMQALMAYQGFVMQILGRYEELRAPDAQKPFFDEMTLITGNSAGEKVLTWTPVLLYALNPDWQVGSALLYSHALDTGGDSALYGPVVGHRAGKDWTFLVGAGLNRSSVVHSGFAGFFMIQYMVRGGVGLTDQIASGAREPDPKNEI